MLNKKNLVGKFHSHITISFPDKDNAIYLLNKNNIKFKYTVIEIEGSKTQTDVMITQHFHTRKYKNYQSIENFVFSVSKLLSSNGINILRVKIEHESLPTIQPTENNYRECHIKMRFNANEYEKSLQYIRDNFLIEGFALSRNPNEKKGDIVHHFLNSRTYNENVTDFDSKVAFMVNTLKNNGIEVVEAKIESTTVDTRLELDRWWI